MKLKKARYFGCDMRRALFSGNFVLAAVGTFVTLVMIAETQVKFPQDVCFIYDGVKMTRMSLLALAFSAVPYGVCFCEDFEHKYIHVSVIRGGIKNYVWSKVFVIFISAWAAMAAGMILFFLFMRLRFPWVSQGNSSYLALLADVERESVIRYSPLLFLVEGAVKESLLGGVLAVCTAYGSLFFKNRLFVYTFPVMFYYLWINYAGIWLRLPEQTELYRIFGIFYRVWRKEWMDFLYAIFVGSLLVCLLGLLISGKITNEIRRD
jgi:hypothetical protein